MGDLSAEFVDQGKALAQVSQAAGLASLLAPAVWPPRQHEAEKVPKRRLTVSPHSQITELMASGSIWKRIQSPSLLIRSKVSMTLGISCSVS